MNESDVRRTSPAATHAATSCLACQSRCLKSELRFSVPGRYSRNVNRLEEALDNGGFEVHTHIDLANLARKLLAVETPPVDLLYITRPLLFLQSLFTGGEPSLFFPFLALLRPSNDSTEVCITSAWSQADFPKTALTEHLMAQTRERHLDALAPLRDTA